MSVEKNDLDLSFLDDLDDDDDVLDGNIPEDKELSSRNPITRVGTTFLSGLKNNLTDRSKVRGIIDEKLPDEYTRVVDAKDKSVRAFTELKDDITKELIPELNNIRFIANRFAPTAERFLPKKLSDKLKKFGESKKESELEITKTERLEETEADKTNKLLDSIFKKDDLDSELLVSNAIHDVYKEKQADLRTKATLSVQEATQTMLSRMVAYQDNITANYQRQSLELQFKHYYVSRDILTATQLANKDIIEILGTIRHNTALPEIQKINKNEVWKQSLIGELFGKNGETAAKYVKDFWGGATKNLANKLKGDLETLKFMVGGVTGGIVQGIEAEEMMGEGKKELKMEDIAKYGSTELSNFLLEKINTPVIKRILETKGIKDSTAAINYLLENSGDIATMVTDQTYKNRYIEGFTNYIGDALPTEQINEEVLEKRYRTTGIEPAIYDVSTRKSIVEIIPGFLSRIHQAIMRLITGEDTSRLVYDSKKEEFTTIDEAAKSLKEEIYSEESTKDLNSVLGNFFSYLDKEGNLSDEDRSLITKRLIDNLSKKSKGPFDPRKIYSEEWLGEGVDEETLNRIKNVVEREISLTKRGNLDITDTNLLNLTKSYKRVLEELPNIQKQINEYQSLGELDVLREAGIVSKEDGKERVDVNEIRETLVGTLDIPVITSAQRELLPLKDEKERKKRDEYKKSLINKTKEKLKIDKLEEKIKEKVDFDEISDVIKDKIKLEEIKEKINYEDLQKKIVDIKEKVTDAEEVKSGIIDASVSGLTKVSDFELDRYMVGDYILKKIRGKKKTNIGDSNLNDLINELEENETFKYLSERKDVVEDKLSTAVEEIKEKAEEIEIPKSVKEVKDKIKDKEESSGINEIPNFVLVPPEPPPPTAGDYTDREDSTFPSILDSEKEFKTPPEDTDFKNLKELIGGIYAKVEKVFSGDYIAGQPTSPDLSSYYDTHIETLRDIARGTWATVDAIVKGATNSLNIDDIKKDLSEIKSGGSISDGVKSLLSGLGKVATGYGGAIGSIGRGSGRLLGGIGSRISHTGKDILGIENTENVVQDIYINGETEARLLASKLRKGSYVNQLDGTVVRFMNDIKGSVLDEENNMETVLTTDDLDKGLYVIQKNGVIKRVSKNMLKLGGMLLGGYGSSVKLSYNILKKTLGRTSKALINVTGQMDLYVGDEKEPRLLSVIMRRGGYFSQNTGKPIYTIRDIDGDVVDSRGNVLLSTSDLSNIYDSGGKEININSLSERARDILTRGLRGVASLAGRTVLGGAGIAKEGLRTVRSGGRRAVETAKTFANITSETFGGGKIFNVKTTRKGGDSDGGGEIGYSIDKQVGILEDIYELLRERLPEPDDTVRGSWRDQFLRRKKKKDSEEEDRDDSKKITDKSNKESESGGGLNLMDMLKNAGKKVLPAAVTTVGKGLTLAAGTLAGAKTALSAGGAVLGGAKTLATGAAAVLSAPVLLKGAAVAATGYGLYRGYKWFSNRRKKKKISSVEDPTPIEELRFLQYGIKKDSKEELYAIREFEDSFRKEYYQKGKESVKISELIDTYGDLFNIDPNDEEHKVAWSIWFRDKFYPVFLNHEMAADFFEMEDLNEIDSKDDDLKKDYIKKTTPDRLTKSYTNTHSPFGVEESEVHHSEVERFKTQLLDTYGEETKYTKEDIEEKIDEVSESRPSPNSPSLTVDSDETDKPKVGTEEPSKKTSTDVDSTPEPDIEVPFNEEMEGFKQTIHEDEKVIAKQVDAQRKIEFKEHMRRLTTVEMVLKESLSVQLKMKNYLKAIHDNLINTNIAPPVKETPSKKDEEIKIKIPQTTPTVTPKVSLMREEQHEF